MQVAPKNAPPSPSDGQPKPMSTRERAIAAFNAASKGQEQAAATPPVNPSQVSPEELGAVKAPNVEQNDTTEAVADSTPKEATPPKEESTQPPLSTQYAVLARKEKALRAKVQAQEADLKSREAALQAREEAIKAKDSEYQTNYIQKNRFKTDPMTALNEAGLSYDELTQLALSPKPQTDPALLSVIEALKSQVEELRGSQEKFKQSSEDNAKQQYQQALNNIKAEVTSLVNTDPEFETIQATGSIGDVVDLIEAEFKASGRLMSVDEAAKEVEEYLVEEAIKIGRLKKIQQRLAPKATSASETPKQPGQTQTKTLTNTMATSRPLSARDRAILAFKGELKS